jgi:hypothetical protein
VNFPAARKSQVEHNHSLSFIGKLACWSRKSIVNTSDHPNDAHQNREPVPTDESFELRQNIDAPNSG